MDADVTSASPATFAAVAVTAPATAKSPRAVEVSIAYVAKGTARIFCRGEISAPDPATVRPR